MEGSNRLDLTVYIFWSLLCQSYLWGLTFSFQYFGVGTCLPLLLNAPHLVNKGDALLFGVTKSLTALHIIISIVLFITELIRSR